MFSFLSKRGSIKSAGKARVKARVKSAGKLANQIYSRWSKTRKYAKNRHFDRNQVNIFKFDWLSGLSQSNKHYVIKFQYGGFSNGKKLRQCRLSQSKKIAGFLQMNFGGETTLLIRNKSLHIFIQLESRIMNNGENGEKLMSILVIN